jgi:hypothetical protein
MGCERGLSGLGTDVFVAQSSASRAVASTVIPYTIPFLIPASVGAHYTDDFNRSDNASLGANWVTNPSGSGTLVITSNAAVNAGTFGDNFYSLPMLTGQNQITVVMKGTPTAGDIIAITARSNTTDTSTATTGVTLLATQGSPWSLYRFSGDGGVSTGGNVSWAAGDTIVFTCVGTNLTVTKNGSTVLTTGGATDLAAGYIELSVAALGTGGPGIGFDSFDAQDI